MERKISEVPEYGDGIGIKWRGDTDTCDVYRNGNHIGVADSTRDRTGNAFAIPDGGPQSRHIDMSAAIRRVVNSTGE